jgi:exodeoxyribonuclease III|tara:strand:- start:360 stop:1058 length:699 start_codon:yes stop_codon:yes gene_type:complete
MKFFSWNIRQGGGSRIEKILAELECHANADLIILSEYRNNDKGQIIKKQLQKLGFSFQYVPTQEPKVNTVLVAAKHFVQFRKHSELNQHQHRVVSILWKGFHILATYFPQGKEKAAVFGFLNKLIEIESSENILLIAGDINTGIHYEDEIENSFYCSQDFISLQNNGMTDAWRRMNGDSKEYSWYSNKGNGFRIDHYLISSIHRDSVQSCYYLHEPRKAKISDHSQMVLHLN